MTTARLVLTSIRLWPKQIQLINALAKLPTPVPEPNLFPDMVRQETKSDIIRNALSLGLPLILKEHVNRSKKDQPCSNSTTDLPKDLAEAVSVSSELPPLGQSPDMFSRTTCSGAELTTSETEQSPAKAPLATRARGAYPGDGMDT